MIPYLHQLSKVVQKLYFFGAIKDTFALYLVLALLIIFSGMSTCFLYCSFLFYLSGMTDSIFGSDDPEPQPPSEKEMKVKANFKIIEIIIR